MTAARRWRQWQWWRPLLLHWRLATVETESRVSCQSPLSVAVISEVGSQLMGWWRRRVEWAVDCDRHSHVQSPPSVAVVLAGAAPMVACRRWRRRVERAVDCDCHCRVCRHRVVSHLSHGQWFSQQLLHWWLPTVETVSRAICRMRSTQFRESLSAPVAVVVAVGNA